MFINITKIQLLLLSSLLLFSFTACSTKIFTTPQKNSCSYSNINLNGQNNFCSQPRTSLIDTQNIIIAFDNGEIIKWDLETKKINKKFDTPITYSTRALIINKQTLFAGSADMKIANYSLDGKLLQRKNYSKGTIFKILEYKNKFYVAFGNAEIGVIDKHNLELLSSYKEHEYLIYSLYIDKINHILYSTSDDNTIIIWNILENGKLEKIKQISNFTSSVRGIVKSDNYYVVTTGDGNIILYNMKFNKKIYEFNYNHESIISLAYIDDFLFIGDVLGNLYLYKIIDKKIKLTTKYKMNGIIRSIKKFKNNIIVITKNGEILTIQMDRLNKNNSY